ncbi:VOC family protein [Solilutibacter silvestris]|uniref:Glyoxalase/fosfomycin resistance/dioxygenase domain-containing protein n=1 Tax=Solilutibacter silvestris TaxID=1645665 RepID=A0A2K1Q0S8_9GAMM|nr:glyoxalase/bleomycin resistance/extradiol dioxygenase family protein [Lysobacter silvestris]PNS08649.1 hypothetical protein Lysil_0278 [Lysobacter silvestris]
MNPYLSFKGDCRQAFDFYQQELGAKLLFLMTWGETPMADQAPGMGDAIMHATLQFPDGSILMGADMPAEQRKAIQGCSLSIGAKDVADGQRLFAALSKNGQVTMPFEKTFWAEGFGMCVDQFGVPWMVNCEMNAKQ